MRGAIQAVLAVTLVALVGFFVAERVGEQQLRAPSSILTAPLPATAAATATPMILATHEQDATSAIQQVIQRSNEQQVQAIAARDPKLMTDTVTSDHYQELVRINENLLDNGVSSISLMRMDWGPVAINGSTATATTFELWRTVYDDGRVEQSRDQNDYTLILDDGAWKISTNDHPQTAPSARVPPPQQPAPLAPPGDDDDDVSHNWSGYAATGGRFTAVSGTWTVPEFTPTGTFGIDAAWVGIGGVHSRDLIQAGTEQTVSGSGRSQYRAWVETLPEASRPISLRVHPGDSVTVSIAEQTLNNWLIQFTNNTTGQTYQETLEYTSTHSSAEWVQEAPSAGGRRGGILPLSDFGTIAFSDGSAVKDGQTQTIAGSGATAITMLNGNNQALAVPSPLGPDGASFSVARTDAPATTIATRRRGR
jgi:hypothetical protein